MKGATMGNWRTIHIIGTCPPEQVGPLREALCYDWRKEKYNDPESRWRGIHGPLTFTPQPSIFGINDWPEEYMDRSGNCSERDYDVEDIAQHLQELLQVAPGLNIKVHCGGDCESQETVATITVEAGQVVVGSPETPRVRGVSSVEAVGNLFVGLRQQNVI